MTTTVGIMKQAIDGLIKEGALTGGCRITKVSWQKIMDRVSDLQEKKKTTARSN